MIMGRLGKDIRSHSPLRDVIAALVWFPLCYHRALAPRSGLCTLLHFHAELAFGYRV